MKPPSLLRCARDALLWLALSGCAMAHAATPSHPVFLEELTSTELQAMVAAGTRTVLVPIGGTEQNGPHMALGKHNVRARYLAGLIARKLGNAIVAPVLSYVPEGSIAPPVAHMRFSGTISIPEATFVSILQATAKSFRQHGFERIVFLGDHGGYQKAEHAAADAINREWKSDPRYQAVALGAYYDTAESPRGPFVQWLRESGYSDAEIGLHAGLLDTSLMLAVDPTLVHTERLAEGARTGPAGGVFGDPRRASAALGQHGIELIVERSVQAIEAASGSSTHH